MMFEKHIKNERVFCIQSLRKSYKKELQKQMGT
jgi:hypothetical protein